MEAIIIDRVAAPDIEAVAIVSRRALPATRAMIADVPTGSPVGGHASTRRAIGALDL
ncbi:hypothetical protein [Parafrankia discariae]|uniref:hypothetical protein n=1 Tax=Parafrankia discariae TaxID=365528 RepID=UPI00035F9432|nr:hypothetical protein [Parafrankia discariae]